MLSPGKCADETGSLDKHKQLPLKLIRVTKAGLTQMQQALRGKKKKDALFQSVNAPSVDLKRWSESKSLLITSGELNEE